MTRTGLYWRTYPIAHRSYLAYRAPRGVGAPVDPNNVCRYKPEPKTEKNSDKPAETPRQPRVHFSDAVRQADIGRVRFHDLRHTYGSMKIEQGENIYDVQRWMGHSSIQVTIDIYGHPLTDRGTDAVLFGVSTETQAVASTTIH